MRPRVRVALLFIIHNLVYVVKRNINDSYFLRHVQEKMMGVPINDGHFLERV